MLIIAAARSAIELAIHRRAPAGGHTEAITSITRTDRRALLADAVQVISEHYLRWPDQVQKTGCRRPQTQSRTSSGSILVAHLYETRLDH